jgi:hypothetical protein
MGSPFQSYFLIKIWVINMWVMGALSLPLQRHGQFVKRSQRSHTVSLFSPLHLLHFMFVMSQNIRLYYTC